jgi:hypothetical protein
MSRSQDNLPLTNARPEQAVGGAAQDKFIIQQLISNIQTMIPVEVTSVSVPTDTLAPIGRCSVKILVQQIDGNNNVYSGGTVINVPYLRVQGGKNAVVLDPVVGDVGLCGFCENELPELDKIIITSIGNENFYYHWNGMPFVSKKYMIQNQEDLKLGVARIASNYDGQHVIHDKKDQIVNLEKWFEQYCQETAQAA